MQDTVDYKVTERKFSCILLYWEKFLWREIFAVFHKYVRKIK